MKKFTKISLIIAAILGGVGMFLCGIASIMGGGYGVIYRLEENGGLDYGKWHIDKYGIYYGEDDETWDMDVDDETDIDVETNIDVETGVDADALWYAYETADIKNLDLDVGAAELFFVEGTREDAIVVRLYNCKKRNYEGSVQGSTLKLQYKLKNYFWHQDNDMRIMVEIPAGMHFEKMDLDVGATNAEFSLTDVSCDTLLLTVGAGNIIAEEFEVKERMDVDAGVGNVEIYGGSYQDVTVSCGMGNFSMEGTLGGSLNADCGMGNMELELEGDADAYNYDLSCGMGELKVNGTKYSSIAGSQKIQNEGAIGTIDLDCGMGNLDLVIE